MADRDTKQTESRPKSGSLPNRPESLGLRISRLSTPKAPAQHKHVKGNIKAGKTSTGFGEFDALVTPVAELCSLSTNVRMKDPFFEQAFNKSPSAELRNLGIDFGKTFGLSVVPNSAVSLHANIGGLSGRLKKSLVNDGQNYELRYNVNENVDAWFKSAQDFENARAGGSAVFGDSLLVSADSSLEEPSGIATIQYKNRFLASLSNYDPDNPSLFSVISTDHARIGARVQEGLVSFGMNLENDEKTTAMSCLYDYREGKQDSLTFAFREPDYAFRFTLAPEQNCRVTDAYLRFRAHEGKNSSLNLGVGYSEKGFITQQLLSRTFKELNNASLSLGTSQQLTPDGETVHGASFLFDWKL